MRRAAILVLLLSGCARDNSPQGQCERQAYDDPAVKQFIIAGASTLEYRREHAAEFESAKRRAVLACLRRDGLAPRGGVERPKP